MSSKSGEYSPIVNIFAWIATIAACAGSLYVGLLIVSAMSQSYFGLAWMDWSWQQWLLAIVPILWVGFWMLKSIGYILTAFFRPMGK